MAFSAVIQSLLARPFIIKKSSKKLIFIKLSLVTCLSIVPLVSQANSVQKVTVEIAEQLLFFPEKKATALSHAINHAQVPAQISAQVISIDVQLGSVVEKGQRLVSLDCQDKKIDLTRQQSLQVEAKAQLSLAKRSFERSVQLKNNRHIGEAELDESQVSVTVAQEKLNQVRNNEKSASLAVQRCDVVAPFAGVVSARLVSEGDYVNTGQSLIKVLEKNNIEIEAQIPLDQMSNFRQAGHYHFISHGQKYPVKLKNIVDFIASNSRSQVVTFSIDDMSDNKLEKFDKLTLDNTKQRILAGMNGMLSWQSKRSFLPAHLLTQRKGRYGIFITEQKAEQKSEQKSDQTVAKFIELPNAQEGRPFELVIDKKQNIIVDGRHRINAGTLVTFDNK